MFKFNKMMKLILFNLMMIFNLQFKNFKFFSTNYLIIIMLINMLLFNFNKKFNNIFYFYSMDYISFYLIMLTNWILMLSILSNFIKLKLNMMKLFMMTMLIMNFFLNMFFMSMNLYMFYIYFEITLIPILFLIMGWGNQINRIQATMYMLFYTLFGSFPLFFFINYIYINFNSSSMFMNFLFNYNLNVNLLIYLMMLMAFLIKMPMYFMHLWLPKAHVEAPISGSMILAGIMLKLGSYGILRLIFNFSLLKFNNYFLILSMMGSLYASLVCLNQIDMKIIVAYSSIVHMSMMLSSLMTLNMWMLKSSMILMLAHGLCASSMFFNVNLIYERTQSRNMMINKGLINISPILSMMWFLTYANNFSSPPSLNLISEIFLINSLMIWSKMISMILITIMFLNTCFSIYIYSKTQHGNININMNNFNFINIREIYINFMHWIPLNIMFLMINLI
uniref:NADH-ubiquinone oxidoreductase chain 4 n=1 Tax=Macrocentrus camphoraphilus TaxID=684659 RepID=D8WHD3_9HYME|nr:NADH dehydrogenase subunit 4 [Macrocentrus camphoraphilus]